MNDGRHSAPRSSHAVTLASAHGVTVHFLPDCRHYTVEQGELALRLDEERFIALAHTLLCAARARAQRVEIDALH